MGRRPNSRPHTHTRMKDTKTGTLENKKEVPKLKIFHVKNVSNHKNHCSPIKLEKKKQAKTVVAEAGGFGREVPIERLGPSHVLPRLLWPRNIYVGRKFSYKDWFPDGFKTWWHCVYSKDVLVCISNTKFFQLLQGRTFSP